jgi:hypothetical protein
MSSMNFSRNSTLELFLFKLVNYPEYLLASMIYWWLFYFLFFIFYFLYEFLLHFSTYRTGW